MYPRPAQPPIDPPPVARLGDDVRIIIDIQNTHTFMQYLVALGFVEEAHPSLYAVLRRDGVAIGVDTHISDPRYTIFFIDNDAAKWRDIIDFVVEIPYP